LHLLKSVIDKNLVAVYWPTLYREGEWGIGTLLALGYEC